MRRLVVVGMCSVVGTTAAIGDPAPGAVPDVAVADPWQAPAPQLVIGYGALPGGISAAAAQTLPAGSVFVGALAGGGSRSGMLGPTDSMLRLLGDLAVAYGITDQLAVALSLDGRYDRHTAGSAPAVNGFVGDPHLLVRGAIPAGPVRVGAQLGIWVPGRDAPSIAGTAISVDLRALVSIPMGPATLSLEGGFQLDNSANSAQNVETFSLAERTALGVSDFDEVYGGVNLAYSIGDAASIDGEAVLDAYVGTAPTAAGHAPLTDGTFSIRGGVSAGYRLTDTWSALAFGQVAKSPDITVAQVAANAIPLVPYEPAFTVGLGLSGHFGGPYGRAPATDCARTAAGCPVSEVPILADISGTVLDEAGKPVVAAKVTLKLGGTTAEPVITDSSGAYAFNGVRIGQTTAATTGGSPTKPAGRHIDEASAEVRVDVDGKQPGTATLAKLDEGANMVPPIRLQPMLPPGELRGVVHSLPAGRPVPNASIEIEPGGHKIESKADGTFQLDLAPGTYQLTVKAPGFAPQEVPLIIDPNGVAYKNIDLQR